MEEENLYGPDAVFAPAELLADCARRFGTPVLIYDGDTLRDRLALVRAAFAWDPGFRQFFPVCAADEPGILRLLARAGSGLVCGNRLELGLAGLAGVSGKDILFLSPFPQAPDPELAAEMGCTPIVNSLEQLPMYRFLGWEPETVGLRFQPDQRFSIPGHLNCLGSPSKFGMNREDLLRAAGELKGWNTRSIGLHIQLSNSESVPGYLAAMAGALLPLIPEVEKRSGKCVSWCDIGGGLAVPDRKRPEFDLSAEAELVRCRFVSAGRLDLPLHTQLGRFLAGPGGLLLTKVIGVRAGQRNFLGVDVSISDLPRSAMTGVSYHVSLLGNSEISGRSSYYVVGGTGEKMDRHGKRHVLPETKPGDILVFHDAGAYTRSMASNYGGSLRCPVVLLEQGEPVLLRRRETEADYFALFSEQEQEK